MPNPVPPFSQAAGATTAVVIHYGDPRLTQQAVLSLIQLDASLGSVIVVDNGPGHEPVRPLTTLDERVHVFTPDRNLGFAGGVELARAALPPGTRYVWLFNNDAQAEPAALSELLRAVAHHGERCVVSSRILDADTGKVWFERARFLPWRLEAQHVARRGPSPGGDVVFSGIPTWRSFPYLSGCSLLIPRQLFDELDGLDTSFFLYGEDVDLSARALWAGAWLVVARRSLVHHTASSGTRPARRERLMAAAALRIAGRYFPWVVVPAIPGALLTGLKRALQRGEPWLFTSRVTGYFDAIWPGRSSPAPDEESG